MPDQPVFRIALDQNEYLPGGGHEVHAIVTVEASGGDGAGARLPAGAEIIVIDCSGSMNGAKIVEAKRAAAAALDALRDGTLFAVVGGSHAATMVYPNQEHLVAAGEHSRAEAKAALRELRAGGGTAIGQWLLLAQRLFDWHEAELRHVILLTDGKDEGESPSELRAALAICEGGFVCDCRGVGTDWAVSELRTIASTLLGTVGIVADPAGLSDDFREMMGTAMGKAVAGVKLRLWTPQAATVRYVKQVSPAIEDLSSRRDGGPRVGDYPTGSWGTETRDYHVCVDVPAAKVGDEMLAARVSLVRHEPDGSEQVLGMGLIRAVWTDDRGLSTKINVKVAHYTGQAELAGAIQEGLDAYKAGDRDTATAKLSRAAALARESGHDGTAKLLANVVEVDPDTGTARLRSMTAQQEMELDVGSTKTARLRKG